MASRGRSRVTGSASCILGALPRTCAPHLDSCAANAHDARGPCLRARPKWTLAASSQLFSGATPEHSHRPSAARTCLRCTQNRPRRTRYAGARSTSSSPNTPAPSSIALSVAVALLRGPLETDEIAGALSQRSSIPTRSIKALTARILRRFRPGSRPRERELALFLDMQPKFHERFGAEHQP